MEIVTKVDNIDTSKFVFKTKYDTDKSKRIKFLILAVLLKRLITLLK